MSKTNYVHECRDTGVNTYNLVILNNLYIFYSRNTGAQYEH